MSLNHIHRLYRNNTLLWRCRPLQIPLMRTYSHQLPLSPTTLNTPSPFLRSSARQSMRPLPPPSPSLSMHQRTLLPLLLPYILPSATPSLLASSQSINTLAPNNIRQQVLEPTPPSSRQTIKKPTPSMNTSTISIPPLLK